MDPGYLGSMQPLAEGFVRESIRYLGDVYLGRMERAVATLPSGDLWWRPHAGALSVGNILLHLSGNVRQWIVSGIGGREDLRDRAREFEATEGHDVVRLLDALRATLGDACAVLEQLEPDQLTEVRRIQGFETSVASAVYHVVEHFSWHTGQAVWIAKARAGAQHGIAFYDEAQVNAARNE